ncbi:MAG: AraC family transcriptional regulator ligand-binding domain-containing protein [Rhodoferax sp.]
MTAQLTDRIKVPAAFWSAARSLGLASTDLVRSARLPLGLLGDRPTLSTAQYFALWQAVSDLSGDPGIGLKLAPALPAGRLPPSLLAAWHARDYRDALHRVARYKQLCAPERLHLREESEVCIIDVEWPHAGQAEPAALVDATLATLLELGRQGTGLPLAARQVDITRSKPEAPSHEAYFGCRVRYCAAHNRLVLHRADLDRSFAAYNAKLLEMLSPALDRLLAEQQRPPSFSERVQWLLGRQLCGGRPDIPAMALELGVSERTLQRRLADEGTSFQHLLSAVRRERAHALLADLELELGEIAFLLGFEDQNSFFRAFRQWEGQTPSHWRAARTLARTQAASCPAPMTQH